MRLDRLLPSAGVFGALLAAPAFAQPPAIDLPVRQPVDPVKPADPKKDDPKATLADADKKALDGAGLKTDDVDGLVKFLKSRTVPEADRVKIEALIKKMNVDAAFDDRLAAQQELLKLGGPAVAVLKKAKADADPEVAYRARECERLMEKDKTNNSEVMLAVVRALGKSNSPDAAAALFNFLPLADTAQLVDLIQAAMTANAGKDGKPVQLLVDALKDENAVRRQVAAVALIAGGTAEKRVRFPDVYPKVVELAKPDANDGLKFAVTKVLLVDCREKEAVPLLCDLMPAMTRGQSWQAEELLLQLAGKDAPKERCKHARDPNNTTKELTSNKGSREKCRDAWKKWWEGAKVDLAKTDLKATVRGELLVVSMSYSGVSQGVITEYGADDKERNRIAFQANNGLCDAVVRADGKLVCVENNVASITVRDATGKVLSTHAVPQEKKAVNWGFQPKGLQALDNGNVVVFHAGGFTEVDKDGKAVVTYARPEQNKQPSQDVAGGVRMKDGSTVLALTTSKMVFVDDKGKDSDKKAVTTGQPNYRCVLAQTGDDKVLVPEQQRLVEYDLKTGKAEGFKVDNIYTVFAQKMANGNVMYHDTQQYPQRLVEKTPAGEEVWSMTVRDNNSQFLRAFVR